MAFLHTSTKLSAVCVICLITTIIFSSFTCNYTIARQSLSTNNSGLIIYITITAKYNVNKQTAHELLYRVGELLNLVIQRTRLCRTITSVLSCLDMSSNLSKPLICPKNAVCFIMNLRHVSAVTFFHICMLWSWWNNSTMTTKT